jgi:predicted metal-dependent phosphoesterase TrpH
MTIWWLLLILGTILAFGSGFIWLAVNIAANRKPQKSLAESLQEAAEEDVDHIFNEEFREELRNRGRLHFEKILGENAMFLQQDLRLTTSQLNEYMKGEITRELKEAFSNYQSAITDAKQLAVESIEKTKTTIDEERQALVAELAKEVGEEKERRIKQFDERMAQVVNHYVLEAVGNQIDLNDQLEYILNELEQHKQAIIEDIRSGA